MNYKKKDPSKILKIVITGVESTGKTTLAQALSDFFGEPLVPEYARSYLPNLNRPYEKEDLLIIAKGQLDQEKKMKDKAERLIICDTDLTVLKVWSEYKFGSCDPWILDSLSKDRVGLYILPHYDVPYEKDVLRENPGERHILFDIYKKELSAGRQPYLIVKGSQQKRLLTAVSAINVLLGELS